MFGFGFRPRLLDSLQDYDRDRFLADVSAGVTVGFVALPLAMAFGIASGVKPEQGIFTAIIAGFLVSLLGGSRVQIAGPAGAFVALLYGIAERYGVANLLLSTMMAGVLLFAMGALRLGQLIRFIPVSVVIGFTSGIAVVIALQQLRDFFGLAIPKMPANSLSQIDALLAHAHTVNWSAVGLGVVSLALIVVWPKSFRPQDARWRRYLSRFPGTIMVLLLGTLAVSVWGLPVETIGTRFGGIPTGLPAPTMPEFDWQTAQNLVAPTLSIALLCAIESLLCARVADGMIGDRHDPNQELMAQGFANFVVPFFGGIAATGTIARTVTNVRTGARSPVAGIVHSATLLAVVLALAPLARDVPLASLAAILLFVAYNMVEWRHFARLRQFAFTYRTVLLTTFALTVIFDLTVAVEVGLVMASLFFIYRMSTLTRVEELRLPAGVAALPDGRTVRAYRVFGSLFFGSVAKVENAFDPRHPLPDVLLLDMHQVINLDSSGLEALESLYKQLRGRGGRLVIADATEQPLSLMRRTGFIDEVGAGNVFASTAEAIESLRG